MGAEEIVGRVIYLAVAMAITYGVARVVTKFTRDALEASSIPSASIFINIVRGVIWAIGILSVLNPVFGIDPTGFVAALGVSSVVLSFGLQDTVSNVFSGLAIMLGKVVQPGDYVCVADFEGFVTDVNWRQTMVRDRVGNVQVIPNSVLNKTAFTRKGASSAGFCELQVSLRPDADLDAASCDIVRRATEALGDMADPDYPVQLALTSFDAYGTHGSVWMHVRDDVAFGGAIDRVARALQGSDWLADALGEEPRDAAVASRGQEGRA